MGKIELWRTVRAAFSFTFGDLRQFFRLSGLWLAGIVGFQALLVLPLPSLARALAAIGMALFIFGGFTAFPLAWHRIILLGDDPGVAGSLRFGRRQLRFLGYGLLVSALVAMPSFLVLGVAGGIAANLHSRFGIATAIIPAISVAVVCCLASRVTLVLPAVAIDETGAVLRRAWNRGRGNGVRLSLGWLLCTVPFVTLSGALHWLQTKIGATTFFGGAVVGALPYLVQFFEAAITVGFLSHSYQQLAPLASAPSSAEAVSSSN